MTVLFKVIHWMKTRGDLEALGRGCLAVIAALFFLAPTGNPWYFTWVLPFLIFWPARALVAFSGLVMLYYLDFYFTYQGSPGSMQWIRAIEYGVFYLFLGWELWKTKQKSPSLSLLQTNAA